MFNPSIHHRHSIRLKKYDYSSAGMYYVTICTQNRENLFGYIEKNKMLLNHAGEMVDRIYNDLINYHNIKINKYIIMPNHIHGIIEIPVGADSISAQNNDTIFIDDTNTAKNNETISAQNENTIRISETNTTNNNKSISAQTHDSMQNTECVTANTTDHISNEKIGAIHHDKKWADMESAPTCLNRSDDVLADIIQTFKRYTTIEYIKLVNQNILPPFNKRIWQRNYYEHIIRNNESLKRITAYIQNNPKKWYDTNEK